MYKWDSEKNKLNFVKHGLRFEDAELVFSNPSFTFIDDRKEYGENRFITLGELLGRIIVLVHTERNERIRIISMRKANEREKKIYYERLKKN